MSPQLVPNCPVASRPPPVAIYVVLLQGKFTDPVAEVGAWLKANAISNVSVNLDSGDKVVLRSSSSRSLKDLHKALSGKKREGLNFSLATFSPTQMRLEECVVLGPIADQQRELIRNLQPMIATPRMRRDLLTVPKTEP